MLAPESTEVFPVAVHYHYWRLVSAVRDRFEDINNDVIAICDCGADLSREQIEAILNGHSLEVQYG